jgi:hypothetical protein
MVAAAKTTDRPTDRKHHAPHPTSISRTVPLFRHLLSYLNECANDKCHLHLCVASKCCLYHHWNCHDRACHIMNRLAARATTPVPWLLPKRHAKYFPASKYTIIRSLWLVRWILNRFVSYCIAPAAWTSLSFFEAYENEPLDPNLKPTRTIDTVGRIDHHSNWGSSALSFSAAPRWRVRCLQF